MTNKTGVYRVVYTLPGSLSDCAQQFVYSQDMARPVREIARECAHQTAETQYGISKSRVSIRQIDYIRPFPDDQTTLDDEAFFYPSD